MGRRRRPAFTPLAKRKWDGMTIPERRRHLAQLIDAQVVAQAESRARASGGTTEGVLTAWVLNGLISIRRKRRILSDE